MTGQLPKYTDLKRKGNIGEALVQYLLSDFCLVHKIDGSSDIGNDFICELIKDEYPTNLLFYVQVKYTDDKPKIGQKTLQYWKSSPIPVYVFWIKDDQGLPPRASERHFARAEKQYKRYTPFLHNQRRHKKEGFKPFNRQNFLRDLIVDYTRTQYKKGFTPVIKPRDFLTLEEKNDLGWGKYKFLTQKVIPEYKKEIIEGGWANLFSLALSLNQNKKKKDKRLALSLLEAANILIRKDKNIGEYDMFISLIEEHIIDITRELSDN